MVSYSEKEIGERIRQVRKEAKMTQEQLAFQLGWEQPKVSRMENGIGVDSLSNLRAVGEALGIDCLHFLLGEEAARYLENIGMLKEPEIFWKQN